MKILWLTIENLIPPNTAGRIGVLKRLEPVSEQNEVYLFYFYDSEEENAECKKALSAKCKLVKSYRREHNKIKLLLKSLMYPYTAATRISSEMTADIDECISQNGIEIINIDFPQMGYSLLKLKNLSKVKIIMNQHNIEWMRFIEMSRSKSVPKYRRLVMRIEGIRLKHFEEELYNKIHFDAQTFVTKEDRDLFQEWMRPKNTQLKVFYGGGDYKDASIEEINHSGEKNIIFVGVMSNEFNPEGAIWFVQNVLPKIKEQINNVKFYVVGKDPISKLKEILNPDVIVTGYVDDLDSYYRMADLVVVPVLHGGGIKLKLLEAIGRNKFVVSTSQGARGTEFKNGESILISDDAKSFAEMCIEILMHPEKHEAIRKQAREIFLNSYTWEKIGSEYNNFLVRVSK